MGEGESDYSDVSSATETSPSPAMAPKPEVIYQPPQPYNPNTIMNNEPYPPAAESSALSSDDEGSESEMSPKP